MDAIDEAYAAECVGIIIGAECKRGVWSAGHNIHELPMDGSDSLAGAILGELIGGKAAAEALRAGWGSFLGLLCGTILKLICCGMMTVALIQAL